MRLKETPYDLQLKCWIYSHKLKDFYALKPNQISLICHHIHKTHLKYIQPKSHLQHILTRHEVLQILSISKVVDINKCWRHLQQCVTSKASWQISYTKGTSIDGSLHGYESHTYVCLPEDWYRDVYKLISISILYYLKFFTITLNLWSTSVPAHHTFQICYRLMCAKENKALSTSDLWYR